MMRSRGSAPTSLTGRAALLCALLSALSSFGVLLPEVVFADGTADEADLHFQLGNDAYREGNFLEALAHFLASNRLAPNRNVTYNIARCYQRIERFPEAYRYYQEALEGETDAATRQRIDAALLEIAPRVALLEVETSPAGATLYVDRIDLGSVGRAPRRLALAPGTYRILAELAGYHGAGSEPVTVVVGELAHVRIELSAVVGVLDVRGETGTEVRIDSEEGPPLCTVPCELPLAPGPHIVHARAEGRESMARAIAITESSTTHLDLLLDAETGSVVVNADVDDALVEIDGSAVGFTPLVAPGIPTGGRTVRVSASGYEPVEFQIEVLADQQVELTEVRLRTLREVSAASRSTERIDDAPASVSVVSAAEIEAFRYPTIYEALRGLRGFALTSDSIYSNASVRGVGQPSDYNNRLLILSDGATLNEDILYQAFIGYDGRVDLGGIERIEVVRGAGSVLYGTGAVSGVVNLVPRGIDRPTSTSFEVSLSDGNVGRGRGAFNVRLANDAGIRGSVSFAHSDGRDVEVFFDGDGDGVPERNVAHGVDRFDAIGGSLRAWAGPFIIQAFYTARDLGIPTGSFGSLFDRQENNYDDHRGLLEVRFEPHLSDQVELRTRVYGNYTLFHLDYLYEGADPATGDPFEQPYQETYHGLWVGGEARVIADIVPQFRLSGGGEGAYHGLVSMDVSQDELDGTRTPILDVSRPFGTVAGYALADWVPVEELRISAGARVDGWLVAVGESFVSVNPRLAIIMHATHDDTIKLMGGRAFRAPSTYEQSYSDGGFSTLPSTCCGVLRPETLYSAELEYTHHFDEDWSVLVSGYVQFAEDLIDSVRAPPELDPEMAGLVYFANVNEDQIMTGGDVEVRRELRGGWMFTAQVGGLYAAYLSPPSTEGSTGNTRIPNAPYLYGSGRGIFPILDRLLRGAVRLSVEAPRRLNLTTNDESNWAVVADVVLSGSMDELGLTYALGLYNAFDWQYALPVTPYAAPTLPQRGRSLLFSLGIEIR